MQHAVPGQLLSNYIFNLTKCQFQVSAVNAQRFEAKRTARANSFCLFVIKEAESREVVD